MAALHTITVAPGVTRNNSVWGYWLDGAKADLLKARLAEPRWFLDGRKRNQRGQVIRTVKTTHKGISVECTQPAHGACTVRFCTGRDEREEQAGASTDASAREPAVYPLPMISRNAQDEARISKRLNEIAASAIEWYGRGKGKRDGTVAHRVIGHAHSWCFDLKGTWPDLVAGGCVFSGWIPSGHWECVGLRLKGRRIELFNSLSPEVSVTYTDAEKSAVD